MKAVSLVLRLSRRAIGAVTLSNESLTLADGRHLTSKAERSVMAARRCATSWLIYTKATRLIIDAPPDAPGTTASRVLAVLEELAREHGVSVFRVHRTEILQGYGSPGLGSRKELRTLVREFFSELQGVRGSVQPYVVDAAAAALYAECQLALSPPHV